MRNVLDEFTINFKCISNLTTKLSNISQSESGLNDTALDSGQNIDSTHKHHCKYRSDLTMPCNYVGDYWDIFHFLSDSTAISFLSARNKTLTTKSIWQKNVNFIAFSNS